MKKLKTIFNWKDLYSNSGKILLVMKLTFLLILISALSVLAGKTYSQTKKLNMNMENASVREVLSMIESQSEFYFMYSEKIIDVNRKVSVNIEGQLIETVLNKLFEGTNVNYTIKDRIIVLTTPDVYNSEALTSQQQKSITGKVTNTSGDPLPGVTVVVKGTTTGTVTNADGNYSLTNIPGNAVLVFSFVGMKTQEVVIGNKSEFNIILSDETISLDEVVAVGYGTQKKRELTGAVSSVKSENFIKGAVSDPGQLLQGKIAGLSVLRTNADPTGSVQISLRGITTLKSNSSPLIIIDGVPGSISMVASEDIESIDVLKDGSAAAIYGTRGTNGVILITTKKVNTEIPPTLELNSYVTTQIISRKLDFMDANEYRKLVDQKKPGSIDYGSNTNWLNEVLQTPVSQVHNFSLKAGKANSYYILNLNYSGEQGIIKKTDDNTLTGRVEINHSMFDGKLSVNGNIMGYEQKFFTPGDGNYTWRSTVYRNALNFNPTDNIKDNNGKWTEHPSVNGMMNPVALLEEVKGENKLTDLKAFGTITLLPVNHFMIKMLLSSDILNSVSGYSETKNHISNYLQGRNGYASRGTSYSKNDLSELTAHYNNSFLKHNFGLLLGYSWQKSTYEDYSMRNWDFPNDQYSYNNMGEGKALKRGEAAMASYKRENKLIGYFFRMNYGYADKYFLMASIRHEGSSKFGADHKWGNFPAVSAGWNMKNESFLKNYRLLSSLKLRAGFGVTGTEPGDPYMSLSRLTLSSNFFVNNQWVAALLPSTNANPDLRWEKKEELNFGVDFGLIKDRISGTFDLYKRTTRDMLWDYNVAKPPFLYSTVVANAGTMENIGIEVRLDFIPVKTQNFEWRSTVIYSTNANKLVALSNNKFLLKSGYFYTGATGEPLQQTTHIVKEGEPIGNFWGFKTIDIDDQGKWIIEDKDGNPKSIVDSNNDDKKVIGNGIPKHYLSWENNLTYKKFDLNVTMRGAFAYQIMNYTRMFYEVPVMLTRGNVLATAFENIYGKRPLNDQQSLTVGSYYIEDGDFWKIDNVTFGYSTGLNKSFMKNLRLYVSCLNFATITGYKGIDPEVTIMGLAPGIDHQFRYPSTRSFTLGLNIIF